MFLHGQTDDIDTEEERSGAEIREEDEKEEKERRRGAMRWREERGELCEVRAERAVLSIHENINLFSLLRK